MNLGCQLTVRNAFFVEPGVPGWLGNALSGDVACACMQNPAVRKLLGGSGVRAGEFNKIKTFVSSDMLTMSP